MSSLSNNYETLTVSGITDISQLQVKIPDHSETVGLLPTITSVLDPKGNFLNVNGCYITPDYPNFNNINITDSKGNIIQLK